MSGFPEHKVKVGSDFIEASEEVAYRGKTHMYTKEQKRFDKILNSVGKEIKGVWKKDWVEVETGVQTRFDGAGERWSIGSASQERYPERQIRIYRNACPVRILFTYTSEYIDYDDSAYSSYHTSSEWIRYES